jgi:hypothetical protein
MYRGRGPTIRTSLYVEDAAIFMAPFKEDFKVLSHILEGSREVTGLVTNVYKSLAAPIRCFHLDLDEIMHSEVHLVEGTADDITWKLSNLGSHTAA